MNWKVSHLLSQRNYSWLRITNQLTGVLTRPFLKPSSEPNLALNFLILYVYSHSLLYKWNPPSLWRIIFFETFAWGLSSLVKHSVNLDLSQFCCQAFDQSWYARIFFCQASESPLMCQDSLFSRIRSPLICRDFLSSCDLLLCKLVTIYQIHILT